MRDRKSAIFLYHLLIPGSDVFCHVPFRLHLIDLKWHGRNWLNWVEKRKPRPENVKRYCLEQTHRNRQSSNSADEKKWKKALKCKLTFNIIGSVWLAYFPASALLSNSTDDIFSVSFFSHLNSFLTNSICLLWFP